jgi:ribosome maturation factor RimP
MRDHTTIEATQIVGAVVNPKILRVWQLAAPLCTGEGMQLVHVEYQREHGGRTLRLYLDKPNGITLDDCVTISRQLGDILDVGLEDEAPYRLEVSSPGTNRPLGSRDDFERYKGRRIKVRLMTPLEGQKNFTGILNDINTLTVQLTIDHKTVDIQFADIVKANLIA